MSFLVRDTNSTLGQLATVEFNNGAGPSTISCIQSYEPASLTAVTATTLPASSFNTIFIAPPLPSNATGLLNLGGKWQVLGVQYRYGTAASGAATATVEICNAGVADGSGVNVLSATNIALNTAASNTPTNATLNSNVDNLQLTNGARLNVNTGATATTGLANFTIMVYLARIS